MFHGDVKESLFTPSTIGDPRFHGLSITLGLTRMTTTWNIALQLSKGAIASLVVNNTIHQNRRPALCLGYKTSRNILKSVTPLLISREIQSALCNSWKISQLYTRRKHTYLATIGSINIIILFLA
jgi:hypothetical protein